MRECLTGKKSSTSINLNIFKNCKQLIMAPCKYYELSTTHVEVNYWSLSSCDFFRNVSFRQSRYLFLKSSRKWQESNFWMGVSAWRHCGLQSIAQRKKSRSKTVTRVTIMWAWLIRDKATRDYLDESQLIVVDSHMTVNKKASVNFHSVFYYCDVRGSLHGSKFHREIGKLRDGAICSRDVCTTRHVFWR